MVVVQRKRLAKKPSRHVIPNKRKMVSVLVIIRTNQGRSSRYMDGLGDWVMESYKCIELRLQVVQKYRTTFAWIRKKHAMYSKAMEWKCLRKILSHLHVKWKRKTYRCKGVGDPQNPLFVWMARENISASRAATPK